MRPDVWWLLALFLLPIQALAQAGAPPAPRAEPQANWELQRQRELQRLREADLQRQGAFEQRPDVRPAAPADPRAPPSSLIPSDELPCFPVTRLVLSGDAVDAFGWLPAQADLSHGGTSDPAVPRCLGARGISTVMARLQNALIARGFVTSRILAAPQDLGSGTLTLAFVAGRVHAIRLAPGSDARGYLGNALPIQRGDFLNLRDLEQGLENLRRLPSVETSIDIVPAEAQAGEAEPGPGASDLLVHWRQARPLHGSFTVDDGGSRAHGRRQGTLSVSLDHAAGLNDTLQFSVQHDLEQTPAQRGLRGHHLQYSMPFGNNAASLSASRQRFHQRVVGSSQSYLYSGESESAELALERLLRRSGTSKTHLSLAGWANSSRQFIEDTEVEVQRRRTAGWTLGLDHRQFIGPATLDATLAYRRGTGAAGALQAPEEVVGEGVSRPRVLSASAQLKTPLAALMPALPHGLSYSGHWRAQWSADRLVPIDRFFIGGRHTVRGFDGESVLAGQRGWLLRQDLAWAWAWGGSGQSVFVGVDHGRVSGAGTESLADARLTGAVMGFRGGLSRLRVEAFAGRPVRQPAPLDAPRRTFGFSLTALF